MADRNGGSSRDNKGCVGPFGAVIIVALVAMVLYPQLKDELLSSLSRLGDPAGQGVDSGSDSHGASDLGAMFRSRDDREREIVMKGVGDIIDKEMPPGAHCKVQMVAFDSAGEKRTGTAVLETLAGELCVDFESMGHGVGDQILVQLPRSAVASYFLRQLSACRGPKFLLERLPVEVRGDDPIPEDPEGIEARAKAIARRERDGNDTVELILAILDFQRVIHLVGKIEGTPALAVNDAEAAETCWALAFAIKGTLEELGVTSEDAAGFWEPWAEEWELPGKH